MCIKGYKVRYRCVFSLIFVDLNLLIDYSMRNQEPLSCFVKKVNAINMEIIDKTQFILTSKKSFQELA